MTLNGSLFAATPAPFPARVLNGLMFNASWLAIVASESPVIAPLVALLHLALHFSLPGRTRGEFLLVVQLSVLGVAIDQLLFFCGVFQMHGAPAAAPLWLSCLWPVLATTLLHAFEGMGRKPLLAAVLGGTGGALSYMAGTQMSAVDFASPFWGPLLLGALWALLFPALLVAAEYYGGQDSAGAVDRA